MTAPLRLTVQRSEVAAPSGLAAEISLQLPSEVVWIEEAVELISRHCLAGHESSEPVLFPAAGGPVRGVGQCHSVRQR